MLPGSDVRDVRYSQLLAFFIPLGISSFLITISHVIINSTLARSPDPELTISLYAIAMSILAMTERPALMLRQTCSALVRDRRSFRAMGRVAVIVLSSVFALGMFISYTGIGAFIFARFFGVEPEHTGATVDVYRVLMFVSVFSGIRCMFQGIIISNMRTKWLTFGMVFRLGVMYLVSLYFILTGQVTSPVVGAVIFVTGMAVEAGIAYWEGSRLIRQYPEALPEHTVHTSKDIFRFYRPLLFSSFFAILIGPAINAMLGKTADMHTAIASFAIAASVTQLISSFQVYIHQIVLNFHHRDAGRVLRFTAGAALFPFLVLAALGFTPLGEFVLRTVYGVEQSLLQASLRTLQAFCLFTLIYPWIDYCNGLLMLNRQTKYMAFSQAANLFATVLTLLLLVWLTPGWNGMIGALGQCLGLAGELGVVAWVVYRLRHVSSRPRVEEALSLRND
jgi:hypothetical protein